MDRVDCTACRPVAGLGCEVCIPAKSNRLEWNACALGISLRDDLGRSDTKIHAAEDLWGKYEDHNLPYVGAIAAVSFLIAGLFAIAITYATPGVGLTGELGLALSQKAAIFLPVVARYATAMDPPLSAEALFRVQSIVSAFMLAGVPSIVAYAIYLVRMPKADRLKLYEARQVERHSQAFLWFAAAFAIYVALANYAGFSEFDRHEAKWCILQASCYARGDDLTIFLAALLKVLGFFGFPLGAFLLVDSSRLLPPS